MFIRSFVPIAALAALVAAAPSALRVRGSVSECDTGSIQCCNDLKKASDPSANALLGLLGVVVNNVDELVGLKCSPIVGSTKCEQQPVCCNNNEYNGLVVIGCSPVNVL